MQRDRDPDVNSRFCSYEMLVEDLSIVLLNVCSVLLQVSVFIMWTPLSRTGVTCTKLDDVGECNI